MDPYEDITRQCQMSSSQEQKLRTLIISATHHEEDDNRLCVSSNEEEEEEETHHSLSPLTPIMICSAPDSLSGDEEQTQEPPTHVRLNSPETGTRFKDNEDAQKSEPTKTKPPQREKDPGLLESTPTRCSTSRRKSCPEVDVECLKPSAEKACIRDQMEAPKSPYDVEFTKEKKEGSFSKFDDAVGGENDENPKKSKVGSSVEFEIGEKFNNDGNDVSVSQVFERLIGSLSLEGNVDKRSSSLIKSQQIASENAAVSRKLPRTVRKQSKEKGAITENAGGSPKLPSSTQSQSKVEGGGEAWAILDKVAIASTETEGTGFVDLLEAAKQAGYTFPRPRWWQPGDEF